MLGIKIRMLNKENEVFKMIRIIDVTDIIFFTRKIFPNSIGLEL